VSAMTNKARSPVYTEDPLTGSLLLYIMSLLVQTVGRGYWEHLGALLAAIAAARLCVAIFCPLAAIAFKWIVYWHV